MTADRIISILSLLSLIYFAYGTWQISKSLARVVDHLSRIREICSDRSDLS